MKCCYLVLCYKNPNYWLSSFKRAKFVSLETVGSETSPNQLKIIYPARRHRYDINVSTRCYKFYALGSVPLIYRDQRPPRDIHSRLCHIVIKTVFGCHGNISCKIFTGKSIGYIDEESEIHPSRHVFVYICMTTGAMPLAE